MPSHNKAKIQAETRFTDTKRINIRERNVHIKRGVMNARTRYIET